MANVQKYTRADVGGGSLTRHYERAKDGEGNYYQFNNQDIDPSLSHLNYNLAPERDQGQIGFINERISEVKCHKRKDVNIMCSWVVTAPREPKKLNGELGELVLSTEEQDRFFKEAYKFLCDKYGEKNVVSAYVHMDEATPHLHFAFVPIVIDKKKGHEKVSAKEALGWAEKGLHKFHGELDAHMTMVFGRNIGVLNEATKDGNKSVEELKRSTAQAEQEQLMRNVSELRNLGFEHQSHINSLEAQKKRLERQIKAIGGKIKTQQGIENMSITISRPTFGGTKGEKDKVTMLKSDYDSLVNTALVSPRIQTTVELKEAKEEISRLENRIESLLKEKKMLQAQVNHLQKQIPKKPDGFEEKQREAIVSAFRRIPDKDKLELINFYNAKNTIRLHDKLEPSL